MDLRQLHNEAMEMADRGDYSKLHGDLESSIRFYTQAYEMEKNASMIAFNDSVGEPTVSVLLRSAASLAIDIKNFRDAEKLIALALSGEPPLDVAEELRNLLENVHFGRHLELKGISLQEDEVRLVISGKGVGYGYAKSDDILGRVDTFQKMAIRTIERKAGRSFRTSGAVSGELNDMCQPFISAPIAASMAFTMKFGGLNRTTLSGFGSFEEVIEDINDNIELISVGNIEAIKKNIPDPSYFNNFIGLAKELAPDGNDVNMFGITSVKNGAERKVILTSRKAEISTVIKNLNTPDNVANSSAGKSSDEKQRSVSGVLSAAELSGKVKITTDDEMDISISVPDGLSDIVRKYFDRKVTVVYSTAGKKKILVDIN